MPKFYGIIAPFIARFTSLITSQNSMWQCYEKYDECTEGCR